MDSLNAVFMSASCSQDFTGWGVWSHLNTVCGVTVPASSPIRLLAILKVEQGGSGLVQTALEL